ncbi:MAG: type II toxin-antitoxin system Phd/YefM family antitoxin [Thermoanaerobaculia bacterium]|nr:type II toxin-antitoxin system Phd/YefM family antitoxin [Thermoanaerobaculia bacterium]
MPKSLSIADARNRLAKVVHDVETGPPVELTRRGKPVAMIVSVREFETLAGARGSFASALRRFRKANDLKRGGIDRSFFGRLRDKSPGRPVNI